MSKGLLFMAFDFATAHGDEFHDWYDLAHVPDRLERMRPPLRDLLVIRMNRCERKA